jgi:transposase-like protein
MAAAEIIARRRKWTPAEKAALLAEVEAEGGRVSVVAQRHGISDSLLYNWRSAWKAAVSMRASKSGSSLATDARCRRRLTCSASLSGSVGGSPSRDS